MNPLIKYFPVAIIFCLLFSAAYAMTANIVYGAGKYTSDDVNLTVIIGEVPVLHLISINYPPNFDFWQIGGYDINGGMPYFTNDSNLSILFMIDDPNLDRLIAEDINYSFTNVQGTGIIIYHDLNLNVDFCLNPESYPTTCTVSFNPSTLLDANYYVKGYIKDALTGIYKATLYTFGIDSTPPNIDPVTAHDFFISGSQIDGIGFIQAFPADIASGLDISSCEYTLNNTDWFAGEWAGTVCRKTGIEIEDGTEYSFNIRMADILGNTGEGTALNYTGNAAVPDPENIENVELFSGGLYFGYNFITAITAILFILLAFLAGAVLFVVAVKVF